MNATQPHSQSSMDDGLKPLTGHPDDFLTLFIADQMFGIPVLQVEDVLREQKVTKIPLASAEIAGSLNLRGRIVTAIDVRKKLGVQTTNNEKTMSIVVEHEGELYSLIIDKVGDVLAMDENDYEPNPATLDPAWRSVSDGIYRLKNALLIVLNVPKLLGNMGSE